MERERKPGRSAEAETCAPKAGCAKFAIYDKIVAVYDKKMLWRANLYIDKKEDALGGIDWNDGHPWNAPASSNTTTGTWGDTANPQITLASWNSNDWGYNEWNKVITYKADGTENTSTNGNGGQIIISSWTRIPTAGNEGTNVDNTVAYGYGCGDSVFDFNRGLAEQSAAMLQMKNNNTAYPPAGSFTDNQTIAPDGKWKFYIFPAETSQYKYEDIKLLDKEPADFFKRASNESKVKIPGFSTYWLDRGIYNSAQCGYTLGIDCSGLVHRSTKYEGSRYRSNKEDLHNINAKMFMGKYNTGKQNAKKEDIWEDEVDPTYSIAIQKEKWVIKDEDATESVKTKQKKLLSHAVPGDILVNEGHVVFVQNLNYAEGSNVITDYEQVDVIHSTSGIDGNWKTWCVHKGNWFQIEANSNNTLYQLRRLKER